ncbi:hypothetical protein [Wolbachia endosymbiont (group A) of Beris morrisii]|uniref:hypothetical protein n=1 Tax=Wolbachia endosymbiont (group A) of Beris morrisii TaxID=3066139 RepID=UPI0033411CD3
MSSTGMTRRGHWDDIIGALTTCHTNYLQTAMFVQLYVTCWHDIICRANYLSKNECAYSCMCSTE